MNKESILKSDVLDILFENRNKSYGAYPLRKFYGNRMMKAMSGTLAIAVIVSAFTFIPQKKNYEARVYTMPKDPILGHVKPPEPKPKTIIVDPKVVATAKFVSTIKFVAQKDSSDDLNVDLNKLAIGSITTPPGKTGGPAIIIPPDNGGDSGSTILVKPVTDNKTPSYSAEFMPSFPGGKEALMKFLQRNLHNPRDMEDGEEINVKMQFVVGYDGKLQSFELVKDGGKLFNDEVLRVLKKMPDWIPGKTNGENVAVYYTIPVKFIVGE